MHTIWEESSQRNTDISREQKSPTTSVARFSCPVPRQPAPVIHTQAELNSYGIYVTATLENMELHSNKQTPLLITLKQALSLNAKF